MPRIRVTARQLGDRHFLILLSPKVALITQTLLRPGKGGRKARVKATYFGFTHHSEAMQFANQVRSKYPKARIEVRSGKRLTRRFEVKVVHSTDAMLEQLAWDFLKAQPSVSDAIATHIQAEQARQARLSLMPPVVGFIDRSSASISRGSSSTRQTVQVGRFSVGID